MSCAQATAEALYLDAQQRLIAVVVLDIAAGQITSISATVNPDKLAHLGPVGDLTSLPGRRDELRRCCHLAPCCEHVPARFGGTSMGTLTPHLVTRDPAVAAAWYGEVLGATEEGRITLPGGHVLSVDLRFGDSRLAIGDEFPDLGIVSPLTLGGTYGALHLAVADAAAVWQKALEAGAKVFEPLHEAFWGDYTGQFIDPFGHRWAIDQHLRDVSPGEVARLAAEAFGEGSG
jgi:PhnB protein